MPRFQKGDTVTTQPPAPIRSFEDQLSQVLGQQYDVLLQILLGVNRLMTQSEQLGTDIAELKTNVAAEIQQVIDALAAAAANATELSQLRAAVTQAHTDLTTLNANLKADDPAAPTP